MCKCCSIQVCWFGQSGNKLLILRAYIPKWSVLRWVQVVLTLHKGLCFTEIGYDQIHMNVSLMSFSATNIYQGDRVYTNS